MRVRTKKNEAGSEGRNARWFVATVSTSYTRCEQILQMCLPASMDVLSLILRQVHCIPEEVTGRRKETRLICRAPFHLLLLIGQSSRLGDLSVLTFRLSGLASLIFHLCVKMAGRGQTYQEQRVYLPFLCRKQIGHDRWQTRSGISMGAEKNSLSTRQCFGDCFLSLVQRIHIILPLHSKDGNNFTVLPQGNVDSTTLHYNIFPF